MLLWGLVLAGVTMMPSPQASPSPNPQIFTERAARLEARINDNLSHKRLAPGQDALLNVELAAARRAYASHGWQALDMLDVIDRQLAELDHILARPEAGRGITVHVGESVTVAMGDGYLWSIENSDPTVLPPRIGVMWARGVQGGFTAKQPGTAILSLTPRTPVPATVKHPVVFTITVLPRG